MALSDGFKRGGLPETRRRSWLRHLPIALIAAGAVLAWSFAGDLLSLDTLSRHREALMAWRDSHFVLAALAYVAVYVLCVAFSVPGAIWLTLTGGFLFGTVLASLLTVTAATAGATIVYLLARSSLGAALRRRAGPWLERVDAEMREGEVSFLLVMRLVPLFPFFIVNLVPAFLRVRPVNFVWTTFVGIAPATVVISSLGSGLGEMLDRGEEPDLGVIFEPYLLGPLLSLALLALLPVIVRKWRARRRGSHGG